MYNIPTKPAQETADELAEQVDDVRIDRRSTWVNTSAEYKGLQPNFPEAMSEVDLEHCVIRMFAGDSLRFGDIRFPVDLSEPLRSLVAKNLAKEAAKELALRGPSRVMDATQGLVYALLAEKLTQRLLSPPTGEAPIQ